MIQKEKKSGYFTNKYYLPQSKWYENSSKKMFWHIGKYETV